MKIGLHSVNLTARHPELRRRSDAPPAAGSNRCGWPITWCCPIPGARAPGCRLISTCSTDRGAQVPGRAHHAHPARHRGHHPAAAPGAGARQQLAYARRPVKGRLIFGLGVGWCEPDERASGRRCRRGRVADGLLAAMRAMWTQPKPSHQGPYVSFDGVRQCRARSRCRPPAHRRGRPNAAVLIAARSRRRRLLRIGLDVAQTRGDRGRDRRRRQEACAAAELGRLESASRTPGYDVPDKAGSTRTRGGGDRLICGAPGAGRGGVTRFAAGPAARSASRLMPIRTGGGAVTGSAVTAVRSPGARSGGEPGGRAGRDHRGGASLRLHHTLASRGRPSRCRSLS